MPEFHLHERILNFAVYTGEFMLKSGAETYRVEDTITRILEVHKYRNVDTFVIPTGIMVTINDDSFAMITKVVRVKHRSTRLDRIELINQLSRDYVDGKLDLPTAEARLEELKNMPSCYSSQTVIFWIGVSCAFFSIMFKGNLLDFFLSFFVGAGVGFLQSLLGKKGLVNFFNLFLCSIFIGFAVSLCHFLFMDKVNVESMVIGCIMPLLPGVAFTTAVRDAIGDELLSGISRGVEALLVAVAIASGVGVSLGLSYWLGGLL
nr:threonine/serine exporter family protein [uncultured Cellulosilyticum sp.]